jgi:diguanylate cyclase (GGDEF)-like protein
VIETSELLRSYLQGIRRLSGAVSASLYVPPPLSASSRAILIHEGKAPARELATVEAAQAWAAGAATRKASESDVRLLALPFGRVASSALEEGREAERRRRADRSGDARDEPPAAWLGLRLPNGAASAHAPSEAGAAAPWWDWLVLHGRTLAEHASRVSAMLADPVGGVPGRVAFQEALAAEMEASRRTGRPLALLFVNPDDFDQVNAQFGREIGDEVVREMIDRLRGSLRRSDLVARYGGVIYVATLPDTTLPEGRSVAEKVLQGLGGSGYLQGSIRLRFSLGLAAFDPSDAQAGGPVDLIRRTDQALAAAKRAGGGRLVVWEGGQVDSSGQIDRLTGIFTGNATRDYRNMVLLWDAVSLMAACEDSETLATQVTERLYYAFRPERVALLSSSDKGTARLLAGLVRQTGEGSAPRPFTLEEMPAERHAFLRKASSEARVARAAFPGEAGGPGTHMVVVPLTSGQVLLGALCLESPQPRDPDDLLFLEALAAQVAAGLERVRLAEQERERQEREQRRLRAELKDLRNALQKAKLEYRSQEMESVLATARRVAPTDATVLITGESGTGKELLTRTIHELSPRRHKPLVIVDCGAIATTLIDSELFGHERGAYTGAQDRRLGRLVEADGGTVFLDEIGELPLEVQSKLLRFVQEKQLVSVGGTRPRSVDVRIIAATNRELEREVAAGKFRADLYHRLNVVRLSLPALRERREDVLHLAHHFLETYAALYHKSVRRLTPEAEALVLGHDWPGNVRELQNRIMQAVILCEADELGPSELGLSGPVEGVASVLAAPPAPATETHAEPPSSRSEDPWADLKAALAHQVASALASRTPRGLPLGRWLTADLVLAANEAAGGVSRRGAAMAGIPETTFRRLLQKAEDQAAAGMAPRMPGWEAVRRVLGDVVRLPAQGDDCVERAEGILLKEIMARVPQDTGLASALLGVTTPTFRRRLAGS